MGSFKLRSSAKSAYVNVLIVYLAILVISTILELQPTSTINFVQAQRSLLHWKRDLEHRIKIYQGHRNEIDDIISTSIYPSRGDRILQGPVKVTSRGNVRFSDLIIPAHSLQLRPGVAPLAAEILAAKTQAYANSKANELYAIQQQLRSIQRQLDQSDQFIYKGQRYFNPQDQARYYNSNNYTNRLIKGTRIFKQAQYVHFVGSRNITLAHINNTNVDRVIDDTYLKNQKFSVHDSSGRLYFEGRKTFWNTVFRSELESGCCGRLQPLDTSRLMLRNIPQKVMAPVLLKQASPLPPNSNQPAPVLIRQLFTEQLYNQFIAPNPMLPLMMAQRLAPGDIGLLPSPPPENFIQLTNLISTHQPLDGAEILKTLVFKSPIAIDEALLSNSYINNRPVIGIATMPGFYFDLSHDNYLLRYSDHFRSNSTPIQRVTGALVVNGLTSFLAGVEASIVNGVENFEQFMRDSVVNINRPTIIQGPVQFNALPAILDPNYGARMALQQRQQYAAAGSTIPYSRPSQNVLIMHVKRGMEIGLINGMRIPQDWIILESNSVHGDQNARVALKPNQLVHVRGHRHFANRVIFKDFLQVNGQVNNIHMPAGVIPLHLNDFIDSAGYSNLWFVDGINVVHLTTHSNQFNTIQLSEVNGGAQSVIMRSMLMEQPDGSRLIRAPLRVTNLNIVSEGLNQGLLNGFRPHEVYELNSNYPYDTIYGRKTFRAPVEVTDCFFNDINQVANWTNHLIRIDRPNTVQTVYTRLAFKSYPMMAASSYATNNSAAAATPSTAVNIDRVDVEFQPDNNPVNYHQNWNFSPEFYLLQQALMRDLANSTGGRYRVNQVRLIDPSGGQVNRIPLGDIVTVDRPFRFADTFTMVGKVEVATTLQAGRIQSNYPIDAMDLVQFDKYRIPIVGNTRAPIRLTNLVLGQDNRASFVSCRLLNGISFSEFASNIMSLTRPQEVHSNMVFNGPVSFEGLVRTKSSLNGIKNFGQFAESLRNAKYSFDEGLQCNAVVVRA